MKAARSSISLAVFPGAEGRESFRGAVGGPAAYFLPGALLEIGADLNRSAHPASIRPVIGPREVVFALAVGTIWIGGRALLTHAPATADPRILELAVTIDLTVTITLLWYLLLVRGRGWPALTVAPVFLASVGMAGFVLPQGREGALEAFRWMAIPIELLLLGVVGLRVRRAGRAFRGIAGSDVVERIRAVAREAAPGRAADVIAYETALLWHALAPRIHAIEPAPDETFLTSHRRAGYGSVVAALLIAVVVETVAVHFLLSMWNPAAAWVLTGLSLYGVLWLVGDYRAIRTRPSALGPDTLRLRLGLRWEVDVPRGAIEAVEPGFDAEADLRMVLPTARGVTLRLKEPIEATGPYGILREAESIAIALDEPERLTCLAEGRSGSLDTLPS